MTNPLPYASADQTVPSPFERAFGAYLGLAVGDALGATVEFMTPSEIRANHGVHRNLTGGGWLHLKPGQVTDDTQMCLAIGRVLIAKGGWDLRAIADEFVAWMRSRPVDIGSTCRRGIRRYLQDGSLAGKPSEDDGGNGAAMRNLPVVLATLTDGALLAERSVAQAHLTHWHAFSDAATVTLAGMTRSLILGGSLAACRATADSLVARHRAFRFDPWPGRTSGYVVDTLQTVLDGFFHAATFEECVVTVVNRGGDADTAGALAGQLAGARFGVRAIPARWLRRLDPAVYAAIHEQTKRLLALAARPTARDPMDAADVVAVS
ncbi:MAG TPA: ADP-ribosyl-[dinitrogen reductase] hydrolase [Opitutaceae bacterium]